jgi:adenosine deaminase
LEQQSRQLGLGERFVFVGFARDVAGVLSAFDLSVFPSLAEHPLPKLVAAGAVCSISTDDPAMFGTDPSRDCEAAVELGLEPQDFYAAGLEGTLCDDATKSRLKEIGDSFDWQIP